MATFGCIKTILASIRNLFLTPPRVDKIGEDMFSGRALNDWIVEFLCFTPSLHWLEVWILVLTFC